MALVHGRNKSPEALTLQQPKTEAGVAHLSLLDVGLHREQARPPWLLQTNSGRT